MIYTASLVYDRSRAFAAAVGATGGPPVRILIAANRDWATTTTGQLILLALCNILPRISERYSRIDLCVPEVPYIISRNSKRSASLPEVLHSRLTTVCPWGRFSVVRVPAIDYDFSLSVGSAKWNVSNQTVYLTANGWRCFVSRDQCLEPSSTAAFNPFTCLATAALGATAVYVAAENLSLDRVSREIRGWSLLDFSLSDWDGPPLPPNVDVGTIIQAGLGGSGNALLWALRYGPVLRGRWLAFEHEYLDLTNANRYLLMAPADDGLPKALLAKREFGGWHPNLAFNVVQGRIEECCGLTPSDSIVLATVDDETIRVHLQQRRPALVLNVGTGHQILSLTRHALASIQREDAPC
ncbi:MAG: hypothetical protein L0338_39120 [Acidobacteria bacterium]|nr:hypothetical protein [Acidobacteriota bacterium]